MMPGRPGWPPASPPPPIPPPKPRPYRRPIGDDPELLEQQRPKPPEVKNKKRGPGLIRRDVEATPPKPASPASRPPEAIAARKSIDAGKGGSMDGDGLADFRFPDDGASTVTGGNDKQLEVPGGSAAARLGTDMASKKTSTSKRARVKRLPGAFKLKMKGFGQRLKQKLSGGKKKLKPKPPVLRVQLDQVMQQAGDTGKIVGMPPPRPEA
ncbi:hypothetical protein B0T19DRAFT_402655 [Cercophora scortea]|uniref:Uncharacterized protein n=1 Tax=Cercophora scortea TaxID=314031 RepID=A0AAE0MAD5_9PEZI|nr:hypothetical protein B0T19DRAFT_402655 [Cercophora scortea]